MAGILIPRREIWTRQPQAFAGFHPSFPRPSFAFCSSLGLLDLAAQKIGTKASGDALRATSQGIAYKVSRAAAGGLDFGTMQAITSDTFSVLVLANGASTDGISSLFSQRSNTAPYQQIGLWLNSNNVAATRAGGFTAFTTPLSGGGRCIHSNSTSLVDGGFHVWGITKLSASANPVLWRDGVIVSGTATGASTTSVLSALQKVNIGNIADYAADNAYASSSDIVVVLGFNSVLSDPHLRALTETLLAPYRAFHAPARRIWIPGSAVSVTLSADAGSYDVSGQSALLKGARQISSAAGAYNAIGQVATLQYGRALPAAIGAYSVAGQTAAVVATRNIGSAAGSYGVAGQAAGLTAWRVATASAGAYNVSGSNAAIVSVRQLPASTGTYASAGQSAALLKGAQLGAIAGSYDLTGESATLGIARSLGLDSGSYAIAGQVAMVVYGTAAKVLTAAPGVFSVSGQIAALTKTSTLTLAAGTYTAAGSPAALRISRKIAAAAGSYGSIGSAAALLHGAAQAVLVASPGAFSLSGQSAAIKVTRRLASASGSYVVAGQQSALKRIASIKANAGSYSQTGQPVTFAYYRRIAAAPGSVLVTGASANLVRTGVVSAFIHGNRRVFVMSGRKRVAVIPRN